MPIIRRITAYCDDETCDAEAEISPQTTQPFIKLAEKGWATGFTDDYDILTYCPNHKDQAPS